MDEMYEIGDWTKVEHHFQQVFGVSFGKFYDNRLTALFQQKVMIDIFKFEAFCIEKGMQEEESIMEFVERKYGAFGIEIIKKLM